MDKSSHWTGQTPFPLWYPNKKHVQRFCFSTSILVGVHQICRDSWNFNLILLVHWANKNTTIEELNVGILTYLNKGHPKRPTIVELLTTWFHSFVLTVTPREPEFSATSIKGFMAWGLFLWQSNMMANLPKSAIDRGFPTIFPPFFPWKHGSFPAKTRPAMAFSGHPRPLEQSPSVWARSHQWPRCQSRDPRRMFGFMTFMIFMTFMMFMFWANLHQEENSWANHSNAKG